MKGKGKGGGKVVLPVTVQCTWSSTRKPRGTVGCVAAPGLSY